jgi:hypothetical protein
MVINVEGWANEYGMKGLHDRHSPFEYVAGQNGGVLQQGEMNSHLGET